MFVTVGTFNLRNLFSKYNFKAKIEEIIEVDGGTLDAELKYEFSPAETIKIREYRGSLVEEKKAEETEKIASRIKKMNVDVLAVQEVEDLDTLYQFNNEYLGKQKYRYCVLVEGNDPRLIDVGVLSRLPIGGVTSWKYAVHPGDPKQLVFGRDLLEVEILDSSRSNRLFKIFNNHLKSHFTGVAKEKSAAAKLKNNKRRTRQAEMVAKIVKARTRPNSSFIILGDMNDPPTSSCLQAFVGDQELQLTNALANPIETRPAKYDKYPPASPAWTHRYKPTGPTEYELYDQIWLSPALAPKQVGAWVDRRTLHKGDGSDHDPAWIKLNL